MIRIALDASRFHGKKPRLTPETTPNPHLFLRFFSGLRWSDPILWVGLCAAQAGVAGPVVSPGNSALRADIQLLADYGVVEGPVTTWPLAWGPILVDLEDAEGASTLPSHLLRALQRVRDVARRETGVDGVHYRATLSGAENPSRVRSFADTPREPGEIGAGLSWSGDRLAIDLNGQAVRSASDGKEFRADGSMLAVTLGNVAIAAGTLDRWWGPGWDGSLILSSNARPVPALTIDRNFTDAFESRWLRWLGPWDLSVIFGRMEEERAIPDTQFFGLRFNFRPLPALEIGLSRTAQWCGEGRPCDLETFADLLVGNDNLGDDGIGAADEPGNQLAGVDFRWSLARIALPAALYGQFIGEDEAGGFPSRFLAQFGVEAGGFWGDRWSYRWFGEIAETSCGFYESDDNFNCAYNHGIYQSGYRYRGRAIGHGADNDARLLSAGLMLLDDAGTHWSVLARYGELNRGGAPDTRNSLTASRQDIASLDVSWGRLFRYGVIELGAGMERLEDMQSQTDNDVRAYIQWRSSP
jgi:hypothetical protein